MAERRDRDWLEGEIVGEDDPGPRAEGWAPEPGPNWIERNRGFIEQSKTVAQTALMFSPPPARLALAALSVAADGVLLAEDMRTGKLDRDHARWRAGGIALETLTLVAASRLAPTVLARNHVRLRKLRSVVGKMESSTSRKVT